MGCGASQAKLPEQPADEWPEEFKKDAAVAPAAAKARDASAKPPPQEQLAHLIEEKPYIDSAEHFLHHYVLRCREALAAKDAIQAQDALDHMALELAHEEKLVAAAFAKFDKHRDQILDAEEIDFMMDYLGFPVRTSEASDLKSALNKFVDSNGDNKVSFDEFLRGVGHLGGSAKLFEVRRLQIQDRTNFQTSEQNEESLRAGLQACGIQEFAQACWQPVLSGSEFDAAASLQPCQQAALRHIRAIARVNHEMMLPHLIGRAAMLGFREEDVWMALAWIRELSPVIIHINLDKIGPHFKNDTHYRNQFETKASSGLLNPPVRMAWERGLFGPAYDDAKPFDRPKYGVQNVLNDYMGVANCKQYGDSYLVLKDVRLRCTLSPEDSANLRANRLATLDFYAHVLEEYRDEELIVVLSVAKGGAERVGNSKVVVQDGILDYKEAQVHGEIDLDKHVSRLVVNERHRNSGDRAHIPEWIRSITDAHPGWQLTWMSDMQKELQAKSQGREMSPLDVQKTLEKLGSGADLATVTAQSATSENK